MTQNGLEMTIKSGLKWPQIRVELSENCKNTTKMDVFTANLDKKRT